MEIVECESGVYDCSSEVLIQDSCAYYDGFPEDTKHELWMVVISGLVMCAMAFGIGANDAANSWGTGVGSHAISLRAAMLLAGIFDFLGAITLGYGVSNTIQNSVSEISEPDCFACGYCNSAMVVYQVGMFGALVGAGGFLLIATFTSMPVSATHAVVGGVVGMTVASVGWRCVNTSASGLLPIIITWITSPVLSGVIGVVLYALSNKYIMQSPHRVVRSMLCLPILLSATTAIIIMTIGVKCSAFQNVPMTLLMIVTVVAACGVYGLAQLTIVPCVESKLPSRRHPIAITIEGDSAAVYLVETDTASILPSAPCEPTDELNSSNEPAYFSPKAMHERQPQHMLLSHYDTKSDRPEAEAEDVTYCLQFVLLFVAACESFVHGANDTANATAPFSAVLATYQRGIRNCDPFETHVWVMCLAGFFLFLGVVLMGHRVVATVGSNITCIDIHSAVCIELSSCLAVLIATLCQIPVSTTHCQIGSVVLVGVIHNGWKNVSWKLFGKILLSWFLTVPSAAGIASAIMILVKYVLFP